MSEPVRFTRPCFLQVNRLSCSPSFRDGDGALLRTISLPLYLLYPAGSPLAPEQSNKHGRRLFRTPAFDVVRLSVASGLTTQPPLVFPLLESPGIGFGLELQRGVRLSIPLLSCAAAYSFASFHPSGGSLSDRRTGYGVGEVAG